MACPWHAMIWMVLSVPHIACGVIENFSLRERVKELKEVLSCRCFTSGRPLESAEREWDLISFRKPLQFINVFFVFLRLEKFKKCEIAQFFLDKNRCDNMIHKTYHSTGF